LQRQVIYKNSSVGKSKVLEAREMALALNPSIKINAISEKLTINNAISLFEKYDIMVDGTDNLQTKYLINDVCCLINKPFVYGSVYKFEGQISVFNYKNGPTYRCVFPEEKSVAGDCITTGVMGVSVGIIGMLQANEVLKMIIEIGEVISGKLLIYNMLNNEQQKFEFSKINSAIVDELYLNNKYHSTESVEISATEALEQTTNTDVIFLDVRNFEEYPKIAIKNLLQIPLDILENEWHQLDANKIVFVFCQSGSRSKRAIEILRKNNFNKAKSIVGGVVKLMQLFPEETITII